MGEIDLWSMTAALFFADRKSSPTDEKQALPIWCHGILTCRLVAHTRCISERCLGRLAWNQYAWRVVLRITLSLSSRTSCERAHVPEITSTYANVISHSRPRKREPKVLPHFQHLPTLTYAKCEHALSCHINKTTIIFEAILPLT